MSPADIIQLAPVVAGAGAAFFLVYLLWWIIRYLRADTAMRASIRQAGRVRRGWKRLALMARLSVTDKTPTLMASLTTGEGKKPEPRTLVPRIKVVPDPYGVIVHAKCLPRVGLEEFQRAASYLADAWGCVRVSITPGKKPGHVVIRGVREDPLAQPTTHTPTGLEPDAVTSWELGLDEYANRAVVDLANVPCITVAGLPGYGKTSLINKLICDFAPSPLVQFGVLDGKAYAVEESDYAPIAPRLFRFVGNDLEAANAYLTEMVELRRRRVTLARSVFGTGNMWHHGPREDWPLIFLIVDEAQTYLREIKARDELSKKRAALVAQNTLLLEELVKQGRSVGIITIPVTQKPTGDALPTSIRDVAPIGLSFAQRSTDAAVAALGEHIRDWADMNPVNLLSTTYVGVLVMPSPDRAGFIRVRTPYVSDADTARIAEATSYLMRNPILLLDELAGGRVVLRKEDFPPLGGDAEAA